MGLFYVLNYIYDEPTDVKLKVYTVYRKIVLKEFVKSKIVLYTEWCYAGVHSFHFHDYSACTYMCSMRCVLFNESLHVWRTPKCAVYINTYTQ